MKKVFLLLALGAFMFSCGKSAEDLNVDDIESECDCVEFMGIILDEAIELKESAGDEPSDDDKKKGESLMEKMKEVEKKCEKMDKKKMKDCDGFDDMRKKYKEAR